ncbi:hypothetical protein [Homoserinimonas sp. OAct 916]|uniref:hypothetical protein n=1 Tax=Homoserinimonas sp. OAct 916 TaxID=2211450 RepID=UPI000DBE2C33|nr:hypothetical protein [Homoserinimonas sp. OAct 916]
MSVAYGAIAGDIYRHMGDGVYEHMLGYRPAMKATHWVYISSFVRGMVCIAAPLTHAAAHHLLTPASAYVLWAWRDAGLPLDATVLLDRSTIEFYIRANPRGLTARTMRSYRARLLRISRVVLPDTEPASAPAYDRESGTAPYSAAELDTLRNWALGQGTTLRRQKALLMLSLSAGAGLKSVEIAHLARRHITVDDDGILIAVHHNDSARLVPLLAIWEPWLLEALRGVDDDALVFGTTKRTHSRCLLSGFVVTTDGDARPTNARLRATWLVTHLQAGTPIKDLLTAAGFLKFQNLAQYLPHLTDTARADYRRILRMGVAK